jgi:hypothetical protein
MGSAALLDQVWALLANDATFLSYRGWFNKATAAASVSAGATSLPVTSIVSYVSGEQLQIMNGSVLVATATVSQTGTGQTIPVSALSAAVTQNQTVQSKLATTSSGTDKLLYIVKEEETDNIVTGSTIPIVLVYTRPGKPDHRSTQVYIGKVVIDCFASTGNTARQMVERTQAIMQSWEPPGFLVCRFAYDTSFKTGITGVKGHRVYYDVNSFVG